MNVINSTTSPPMNRHANFGPTQQAGPMAQCLLLGLAQKQRPGLSLLFWTFFVPSFVKNWIRPSRTAVPMFWVGLGYKKYSSIDNWTWQPAFACWPTGTNSLVWQHYPCSCASGTVYRVVSDITPEFFLQHQWLNTDQTRLGSIW